MPCLVHPRARRAFASATAVVAVLALSPVTPAQADTHGDGGFHGGGGHRGGAHFGGGFHGGWHHGWNGFGVGVLGVPDYDWEAYEEAYPYDYGAPYYPASPSVAMSSYWYYCQNPAGYYPYVQQCSGAWQPVPAGG
jgi:hypothetical protein